MHTPISSILKKRATAVVSLAAIVVASASVQAQSVVQGPSSSRTPYLVPAYASGGIVRNVTSIATATDLVPLTGSPNTPFEFGGIIDGLGAYDNGNGTVTVLACFELGTTRGVIRRHGAVGAYVTEIIIDKQTLQVVSSNDLIEEVIEANGTVRSVANGNPVAMGRFCSADLPAVSAYYNPKTGLGTTDRIFMCGEEFAGSSWMLGHVATGAEKGKSYVLPAFNLSTNGSGITALGSWENALANPFPQDLTIVAATNDGGSSVQNNRVSLYVGTKQGTGTAVEKAGLKNGQHYFVQVIGSPTEIVSSTTRATNITSGTRFTLDPTVGTQFSRPEDGHWDPQNPRDFYFVTTDRLNTVNNPGENQSVGASGTAGQVGKSRLWRMRFDDLTNPTQGGVIDLLIDGQKNGVNVNMMDNMCVGADGMLYITEDPGNSTYLAKTYAYDITTDTLVLMTKYDPARWGDLAVNGGTPGALSPYTNDKEVSGIIDVTSMFPHADDERVLLLDAQDHSTNPAVASAASVEGGQLLLMRVAPRQRATAFGLGCGVSLSAGAGERPTLGAAFDSQVTGMVSGASAFMSVGLSNTTLGGNALPIALDSFGMTGCSLYNDTAIAVFAPCTSTGATTATYSIAIPSSTLFVGQKFYQQAFATNATANLAGLVGSNALQMTIGF
jgi:hypothetical protein